MSISSVQKVAVVVVTYNRSDVTNLMLESVCRALTKIEYEMILIDNASAPAEVEKIERFFTYLVERKKIKGSFHKLRSNTGFPGGNNFGIRTALLDGSFTHICLLNNDTIVTDGWLDSLVLAAGVNSLVGPVSNSVGNEQVVPVNYQIAGYTGYTLENVRLFATEWVKNHDSKPFTTHMLGFFCVLASRLVFEKVGLLDEKFGIGTFEDDDFCLRCEALGVPLLIVRHVFIHHWGSATFGVMASLKKERLTERNKRYFESKHGQVWKSPVDTIPVSMMQEQASASADYFNHMLSRYADILVSQIRWFDQKISVVENVPLRSFLFHHLNGRIEARRSEWPRAVRLISKFFVFIIFGSMRTKAFAFLAIGTVCKGAYSDVLEFFAQAKRIRQLKVHTRKLKGAKTVLIFPIAGYAGRKQRSQHLARELAELGQNVIWIDPVVKKSAAGYKYKRFISQISTINSGLLTVVASSVVDFSNFYVSGISKIEAKSLLMIVKDLVGDSEVEVIVQSPFWTDLITVARESHELKIGKVIYDCMDDHLGFGSATQEVEMLEYKLLDVADCTVVSSSHLKKIVSERLSSAKPLFLIRNAVQLEHFVTAAGSRLQSDSSKPVVGYFGAIAEWFDHELLLETARRMQDVDFELIGNAELSAIQSSANFPKNVKLLGERAYADLPALTRHWRAGLIPFHLTPLIIATNPVKMYEYSALSLPIVSTPIPEVIEAGIKVYIGADVEGFVSGVRDALASGSDIEHKSRQAFALNNTWRARAEQITHAFSAAEAASSSESLG